MKTLYAWFGARECQSALEYIQNHALDTECAALRNALEIYSKGNDLISSKTGIGAIRDTIANAGLGIDSLVVLIDFKTKELQAKCAAIVSDYRKTYPNVKNVVTYPCVIPDPYDLTTEYQYAKQALKENCNSKDLSYFLLESGTGTMTACWILLGRIFCQDEEAIFVRRVGKKLRKIDIRVDLCDEIRNHFNSLLGSLHGTSFAEQRTACGVKRIIGHTDVALRKKKEIMKAAACDYNVLLTGDTGTGKEVYARAIVEESKRSKPYIIVNCASLSPNLAAAQLFGHTKGAFTGANEETIGKFEEANGGTLFLDEIEALPMEVQGELLRVLEGSSEEHSTLRIIHKVGSGKSPTPKQAGKEVDGIEVDVRIIAATNVDLKSLIRERKFRADLYYRLNDIEIVLPGLAEHRDDIRDYADYFLELINLKSPIHKCFSAEAINFLISNDWSGGNQRELKKRITRAHIFSDGTTIEIDDLRERGDVIPKTLCESDFGLSNAERKQPVSRNLADLTDAYNRSCAELIRNVLKDAHSLEDARRRLGLENYQTLKNRMEKLGIGNPFSRKER